MLLGGTTMLGWLLHVPPMVELRHGLVPMVFNTGLCFFLCGAALLLSNREGQRAHYGRLAIATVLMVLCGAMLVEHMFDVRSGLDLAGLHTWYDYGNTRPGRMAPNTASGFILFGAALLLADDVQRRRQAIGVVLLTFCLLAVGSTGLAGYLLAPELLFNWARSARMALHTATGMILGAIGLWSAWSCSAWYAGERFFQEDGKIRMLSAAIMVMATLTIGLTGFVLLQGNLERALENRLEAVVNNRGPWFRALTGEVAERAHVMVRLSGMEREARALLQHPADAPFGSGSGMPIAAGLLREPAVRGVGVSDASGYMRYAAGSAARRIELGAPLDAAAGTELIWDEELMLRVRIPLAGDGTSRGGIVIDMAMSAVQTPLFNMVNLGRSVELAACVERKGGLLCFPDSQRNAPYVMTPMVHGTKPLPMQLALAGGHGVVYAVDYKGHNVLAAYGELAPGLGFVVKQETEEAYAGIRKSLAIGAPVIAVVSLLGAVLLFSQLSPLVSKMRASELAASEAAAEMETIMAAAGDGIVTFNQQGRIESVNVAACRIFGYASGEIVGQSVALLMPAAVRDGRREELHWLAADGVEYLTGTQSIGVQGLRSCGEPFPLELSINAVPLHRCKLYIGILRDITVRKEMEERLSRLAQFDTLTGLPNRALFMDRLGTALARVRRSQGTLALMFLDLDGFKAINDTFGHQGGDLLLTETAARLLAVVRDADTVARLAGDEFTIILESLGNPAADAVTVAHKLVSALQAPFLIDGREARVTASIGLVIHDMARGDIGIADLLRRADDQMYAVKRSGKNAFRACVAGAASV